METVSRLYAILLALFMVLFCVLLHTFLLSFLVNFCKKRHHFAFGISRIVLAIIAVHLIEVMAFGFAFWLGWRGLGLVEIRGLVHPEMTDFFYFSIVCYTTLGFGDLTPTGDLRLLAGVEAITGLVMITWSATFTFLIVQNQRLSLEETLEEETEG